MTLFKAVFLAGIALGLLTLHLSCAHLSAKPLLLGVVKHVAEARLNGRNLGVVGAEPFSVEITGAVKPSGNELEINLVNLWPNRMIGDAALPVEQRLTRSNVRMDAKDQGVVFRHGTGPGQCDSLGARDVWVYESGGTYYMHYDGAGPKGWLACLATSTDLLHWVPKGPVLDFGAKGEDDSASASYGVTYFDGKTWHMFYLGTPNVSPAPDLVPSFPYLTMKARATSPAGPWIKQKEVIPFRTRPGTYYADTASPGQVIKQGEEHLMFFSASMKRTLGIARTRDLDGPWAIDPAPIVPPEEQIENSSLHFEPSNQTWFLFTNHIGVEEYEYTDAVWVYWTKDLNRWNAEHKAVVLDGKNCTWSRKCIGLPSVVKVGHRLAVVYDAPGGDSMSHMKRDVGLSWLDLPLVLPANP